MNIQKLNIPFARKVLEFVETEHDDFEFNMGIWYRPRDAEVCKTSACLAGTAVMLSDETQFDWRDGVLYYQGRVWNSNWVLLGATLLGLDDATATTLFLYCDNEAALAELRGLIAEAERAEYLGD